jgi:orotate phosphoribosyltransferase
VCEALLAAGAEVMGAGSIIDRSNGEADLGVRRVALETMRVTAFPESDCPMCRDGIPVEKPGSRKS